MSSKLSARKRRASFETEDTFFELGRNRNIIIELRPTHAVLRLQGCRRRWAVGYEYLVWTAIKKAKTEAAAARAAARKQSKDRCGRT